MTTGEYRLAIKLDYKSWKASPNPKSHASITIKFSQSAN
jgi:hypothetical protein